MEPNKPSRRHWLGGMLAGLISLLRAGKCKSAAPPPTPAPPPDESFVTISTYDADGRLISTRQERRPRPSQLVVTDASGRVVSTTDLS